MATGRTLFSSFEGLLNVIASILSIFGRKVNVFWLSLFRNTPGYLGLALRYIFLKNCVSSVGKNVAIHPNVYIKHPEKLTIGNNVSLHPMTYIEAGGGLQIGNDVSIAHNVSILTINHSWTDSQIAIKYNDLIYNEVVICDDVWIGCGVRILPGVKLNKRVIVAAGAVVNKSIAENSLVGGVPARTIKVINN